MSDKRAGLNLNDDIDISDLVKKPKSKNTNIDKKQIEKIAEESGFQSREPKKRKTRPKSPYIIQMNVKTKYGAKELFQEVSERLGVFDHTTFEEAFIALLEKKGFDDILEQYKNLPT